MDRRLCGTLLILTACAPAAPGPATSTDTVGPAFSEGGTWVDLTHPFSPAAVYWPTARGFEFDTVAWGQTEDGYFYSAFNFSAAEHGGTHLDAPIHFAEGRRAVDQIPIDGLIGPAAVVDVRDRVDPDYRVTRSDIESWEAAHGPLPDGAILLLRTGWGERYDDREAYLGTSRTGPGAVPELHFPGLDPDAAHWLVAERSLAAVGIDTPSIDYGQSTGFESHVALYSADIPGFENVAGLEAVPETGAWVIALPMKIQGGSGAPLRIIAWVPSGGG